MTDVLFMTFLGLIAGMVSVFWTRIIKRRMIFDLQDAMNRQYIKHGSKYPRWVFFVECIFCQTPWLVFVLETIFIVLYTPYWILAIIGVLGGLGAGNLVCEIVYTIRRPE